MLRLNPQRVQKTMPSATKDDVEQFWNAAACGEVAYAKGDDFNERMRAHSKARYSLEPFIPGFAKFNEGRGKHVLEIGLGLGTDHQEWAAHSPSRLCGIDLTQHSIDQVSERFRRSGLKSELQKADAENLPFPDGSFDIVYSWGVLHHTPDTPKAFSESARVLKPNGIARIMIYHTWSLTGLMLWARYSLKRGERLSMAEVYSNYLESPGTKAYTIRQAREMAQRAGFRHVNISVKLGPGDLLQGAVGQRHRGALLSVAKAIWPRPLFRLLTPFLGLFLLIEAQV